MSRVSHCLDSEVKKEDSGRNKGRHIMIGNIKSMAKQVAHVPLKLGFSNFKETTNHLSILFKRRFSFWRSEVAP